MMSAGLNNAHVMAWMTWLKKHCHDAHVKAWMKWLDKQGYWWSDATLDACFYWGLIGGITTLEAAMLLSGLHPRETTEETAIKSSQGENYQKLLREFNAVAQHHPVSRTLQIWLEVAKDRGLSYDPWIDGYARVKAMQAPPPRPLPVPMMSVLGTSDGVDTDSGLLTTFPHQNMALNPAPTQNTATHAPVATAKRSKNKPSIETVALDYMRAEFKKGQFQSAAIFHKHLIKTAGLDGSPFEKGTGINAGKLFCTAASSFFDEGTLGKIWAKIRAV